MTLATTLILIAIPLLIVISALFSTAETALTAVSRSRMRTLGNENNGRARRVNELVAAPERVVGTALLGRNLANVLAAVLATILLVQPFGAIGIVYATVIVTTLIVIFVEVLPKTIALAYPERIALAVAPLMQWSITALRPLTASVEFVVRHVLRLTPDEADDEANILAAREEIRGTIEMQKIEGSVPSHDADMLGGVLDLRDLQVADIMVHRTKMETANADDPPEKIVDELLRSQYSRVPVWKDEPENIVGVLHAKDIMSALGKSDWNVNALDIMSYAVEPWFVPDTTPLKGQLNQFLKRKAQMALVVDEYGEVQGLITLEDILEEIVGQIADEHDTQESVIRVQADGTVNVDGTVTIRDLNRYMHWVLPDEEATTIAGLVIHEAQTIPEPGRVFTFYGYRFEVLRKTRNKITALRISPPAAIAATAAARNKSVT